MRILVCGGRDYGFERNERDRLYDALDAIKREHPDIDLVIYGCARGADELARKWALERKLAHLGFPADWDTHGKAAGGIRNHQMLKRGKPDLVVAFPGGRGTADMVRRAKNEDIPTIELE